MMPRKKHIVFIVDSYYPKYSANGICVKKIIDTLKGTYNITLICINNKKGLQDIEDYDSIRIVRIDTLEYSTRNYVNCILEKSNSKLMKSLSLLILHGVQIQRYINAIVGKENIIKALVNEYTEALRKIKQPIDLIVPTCYPFESIVAAIKYKSVYNSSVKVAPYLFDKFSASKGLHRTEWNKKLKMQRHLKLEKTMLENSDCVISTNDWEEHLRYYFNEYIKKLKFVEIPGLCEISRTNLFKYDQGKVHFVYTGALEQRIRPPQYALNLFSICMEKKPEYILHLYISGNCVGIVNEFVKKKPNQILNHGSVPVESAYSALSNANVLLSIGNTDITQKPSKIYEYMACGKPIIHLYNDEKDPVINILEKYGRACCVSQNSNDMQSNIMKIFDFVEKYRTYPLIPFNEVRDKFSKCTPEYTAKIFIDLLNK